MNRFKGCSPVTFTGFTLSCVHYFYLLFRTTYFITRKTLQPLSSHPLPLTPQPPAVTGLLSVSLWTYSGRFLYKEVVLQCVALVSGFFPERNVLRFIHAAAHAGTSSFLNLDSYLVVCRYQILSINVYCCFPGFGCCEIMLHACVQVFV